MWRENKGVSLLLRDGFGAHEMPSLSQKKIRRKDHYVGVVGDGACFMKILLADQVSIFFNL